MSIDHPRVRDAVSRLDRTRPYERADRPESVYLYQLRAAARHGVHEPFDDDAKALNAWLLSVRAGRELVDDAWDAFMAGGADTAG